MEQTMGAYKPQLTHAGTKQRKKRQLKQTMKYKHETSNGHIKTTTSNTEREAK